MRGEQVVYLDFSGGVNLASAPYLLQENQARDALNVHPGPAGQLQKRKGFQTLASLSASPASFSLAAHSLGTAYISSTPYLLAVGKIGASDDRVVSITGGGTVTDRTPGALPYTVNKRWYFAQAPASGGQGPIFAMNGTDTPQQWTGSGNFADWTASSGTVPPTGKFLTYHGSRLWCAESGTPGRIRYSGITGTAPDVRAWDANDYVDLEREDGEEITAICPIGSYLAVFKHRKAYIIYDIVTGANRKLSSNIGCAAHRSCAETPAGLFFWDEERGIMSTDGDTIEHLSTNVDSLLASASASNISDAAATFTDNRYLVSFSTDGTANNKTVEYHLPTNSWWVHDCAVNEWAVLDPIGTPKLYGINPTAISVQQAFVPNLWQDLGSNYTGGAYITGSHLVWEEPHIQKRVRELRVDGSGEWVLKYAENFTDIYTTDAGEVWDTTDTASTLFAPSSPDGELFAPTAPSGDSFAPISTAVTDRRYYTLGVARAWSFKLANADAGDFQIYSSTAAITRRTD